MSYDVKCDELARHFLQDKQEIETYEEDVADLAEAIQGQIEDWLTSRFGGQP